MSVSIIYHNGKKILYSDFSNVKTEEQGMAMLEESDRNYQAYEGKVRHLLNLDNAIIRRTVFERSKALGLKNEEKCLKDAFVGISPIIGLLLKGYLYVLGKNHKAMVFEDIEKAKDWLAE
jgi:hypothetical protein